MKVFTIPTYKTTTTVVLLLLLLHCVSKNDTDVALYNFNSHQPILVIFGKNVAERAHYHKVVSYPTSPKQCFCTTWGNMNPGNGLFSTMSRKRRCFSLLYCWQSSTIL